jgi:hypothetical protein
MKLVIGSSRWRHGILLLSSLAFVAGGILILAMPTSEPGSLAGQRLAGWSSTIFFGGCALIFVWQLIDSRPRLIIDDDGIYDRTLGIGRIPWSDIRGAYLRSISKNVFICLELRDSEHYVRRTNAVKRALAGANAALGFTPISLNLSGVAADPGDILELILKSIPDPNGVA